MRFREKTKTLGSDNMVRSFDIVISFVSLLALLPLFLAVALVLRLTGEGYIFYRQVRIGKGRQPFELLKFATMLSDSASLGTQTVTMQDDPRVLPVGVYLRKSKINELPQLWNVLCGDMSLVGPRPQPARCFNAFSEEQKKTISSVRPGITGLGSIVFRSEDELITDDVGGLEFYDDVIAAYKGDLEVWYVQHTSISMYFRLIMATAICVVFPQEKGIWRMFPQMPMPPPALSKLLHEDAVS